MFTHKKMHDNAEHYLVNGTWSFKKSEERRIALQAERARKEKLDREQRQKLPKDYVKGIKFVASFVQ